MKNAEIIQQLNLEQKCALLSGETVFTTRGYKKAGIPSITLSDGPNGVRKQAGAADHLGLNPSVPATCFPTAATVACSWDPALGEQVADETVDLVYHRIITHFFFFLAVAAGDFGTTGTTSGCVAPR